MEGVGLFQGVAKRGRRHMTVQRVCGELSWLQSPQLGTPMFPKTG